MPRSQSDLVAEALGLIRVTEVGETAATDEINAVTDMIVSKQTDLLQRRVFNFSDLSNIPDMAFISFAKIIANAIGPKFGRSYDLETDQREEARLRDLQTVFSRRRALGKVVL